MDDLNFCTYDLYMSIGGSCRPALHLRDHFLRTCAFPLDWMMRYSLDTVLHLFETRFEDFFDDARENIEKGWTGEHRWVEDKKNGITSIHHFPREKGICEFIDEFRELMRRRFAECERLLNSAEKVMLLANRGGTQQELSDFLYKFSYLYSKPSIRIINMKDDRRSAAGYSKSYIKLTDKHDILEYSFNDTNDVMTGVEFDARGNNFIWNEILNGYGQPEIIQKIEKFKRTKKVILLYGAGARCRQLLVGCEKYGIPVAGIAVSDIESNPTEIGDIAVRNLEYYRDMQALVVITIKDKFDADYAVRAIEEIGMESVMMDDFVMFSFE